VRSSAAIGFFFLISPFIPHPFIEEVRQFPWELIGVLLAFGFVSRFLLVFSYYEAIERLPIPTISLLSTLVVAGGTLFAHLYLGEPIHGYQAAGTLLIILGAMVVEWAGLARLEEHLVHYIKSHRLH
jgi:drug/metabolite transporter (DMT)-like permease